MDKTKFEKTLKEFIQDSNENYIKKEDARQPELSGLRIFEDPLVGYASADDPLFEKLKTPGIIGPGYSGPKEWLPEAKTVVSYFLHFTEDIRKAERLVKHWPSDAWLHGRIQGQAFQNLVARFTEELLKKEGFSAIAPMVNSDFSVFNSEYDKTEQSFYMSNWSERHAAYTAGLGTFGLSRGLISKKGVAGRYNSVITSAFFEVDERPYEGIYDYCSNCGECTLRCPVGAISKERGKMHFPCSTFLNITGEKYKPYYGCGKCQVDVPCEGKAPMLNK